MKITVAAINVFFDELGVQLNKEKCDMGFKVKYLGWNLDTKQLVITCPRDKIPKILRLLHDAKSAGRNMRARDLAKLVGMLTWLSYGCQ